MCFAYKPYNEACLGCTKSRSSYSKAMTLLRATPLCVFVPRRIILFLLHKAHMCTALERKEYIHNYIYIIIIIIITIILSVPCATAH